MTPSVLFLFSHNVKYTSGIAANNVLYILSYTRDISHLGWPSFNYVKLSFTSLAWPSVFHTLLHWPCLSVYILFNSYSIVSLFFTVLPVTLLEMYLPSVYFNKFVPCHFCLPFYSSLNNPLADPLAAARPAHPARYLTLPSLISDGRPFDDLLRYTQPRYHQSKTHTLLLGPLV